MPKQDRAPPPACRGPKRNKNKGQPINKLHKNLAATVCGLLLAASANGEMVFDSVGAIAADSVKKFAGMRQHGFSIRYAVIRDDRPWWMPTSLDLSAGRTERNGDSAAFVSFGPTYRIRLGKSDQTGWFTEIASHPTYVGRSDFNEQYLGGNFHFTSYLGIGAYVDRSRKTSLMLRYQHTSNAGLSDVNPGVDMLALTFSYYFGQEPQRVSATDFEQ